MSSVEVIGYLASALVFATFYMKAMLPLRFIAIASNVVFIAYGHLGGMTPIILLHAGLLPLNAWRLFQMLRVQAKMGHAAQRAGPAMRFLRLREPPRRLGKARRGTTGGGGRLAGRAACAPGVSGGPPI